jgi:hypothetical protein
LPEAWVSATTKLFEQGLADPRGCEYREIEVAPLGDSVSARDTTRTHGWVLPRKTEQDQQFAVCWDGLVHLLAASGKPADLRADVQASIQADEERRADSVKQDPGHVYQRYPKGDLDHLAIGAHSFPELRVCLLLRLGEGQLAESLYEQGKRATG